DEPERLARETARHRPHQHAVAPLVVPVDQQGRDDLSAEIGHADAVAGKPKAVSDIRVRAQRAEEWQAACRAVDGTFHKLASGKSASAGWLSRRASRIASTRGDGRSKRPSMMPPKPTCPPVTPTSRRSSRVTRQPETKTRESIKSGPRR